MKKTETISVRLSKDDLALLRIKAKECGGVSNYIHRCLYKDGDNQQKGTNKGGK
jgi:hypothetical protein